MNDGAFTLIFVSTFLSTTTNGVFFDRPMSNMDQRYQLDITIKLTDRVFCLKYVG